MKANKLNIFINKPIKEVFNYSLESNIENIMNDKKVVLVTGGTSGIGLGTIEYLLEQGNYEIISLSRGDKNLSLAKEKLGENTNKITFLQGDNSKEEDCRKIYEEINKKYSKLDGLVNSAGIIKLGGIEKQTLEEWNNSININLTGMFLLTKTLLPLLKKGKNTSIVNISSMSSERAGESIAYCASKAGVDMLTKYMGQELGKYNIRVNSVNPAAVYTNIYVASGDYTQEG